MGNYFPAHSVPVNYAPEKTIINNFYKFVNPYFHYFLLWKLHCERTEKAEGELRETPVPDGSITHNI